MPAGPFEGKKYLDKTCDPAEMKDSDGIRHLTHRKRTCTVSVADRSLYFREDRDHRWLHREVSRLLCDTGFDGP